MSEVIAMKKYGIVLTGREFGKDVAKALVERAKKPLIFDFAGVLSLGSSFGEEVIPMVAALQNKRIEVRNTNEPIRTALRDIAEALDIVIKFK